MIFSDQQLLARAIRLARENVTKGGGPFGAVISRDGEIIAESANRVIELPDPTAHAEVEAIRAAAKALNSYDLSGCNLFTSCEPCPMCLGAVYWARISRVVYASDREDAARAGFRDAELYTEITVATDHRAIPFKNLRIPESGSEFDEWLKSDIKKDY